MQLNTPPCPVHWEPEMLLTNYLPSSAINGPVEASIALSNNQRGIAEKADLEGR